MADFPQVDHRRAIELCLSAEKLVFFCGSGISIFPPSCLLSGRELVQVCLDSIVAACKRNDCRTPDLRGLSSLPLETLVGLIVEDLPRERYLSLASEIVAYFQDVTPNGVHILLAKFLLCRRNVHVITTNYDVGIENALLELQETASTANPVDTFGLNELESGTPVTRNTIFKIHGCASRDRPEDIILTTHQESAGLPARFSALFKTLLEGSLVVFLGYSLSEPDCLEALMDVSAYDAIWTAKDLTEFNKSKDSRIGFILGRAKKAFLLENLLPLLDVELPAALEVSLPSPRLIRSDRGPCISVEAVAERRSRGTKTFQQLTEINSKEKLIRILVEAFLHLKELDLAAAYIDEYGKLSDHSLFHSHFWTASLIRERGEWPKAKDGFAEASREAGATWLDQLAANVEELGIETILSANDDQSLKQIETKIADLIRRVKQELLTIAPETRLTLLSVLGRLQKNFVQNKVYQSKKSATVLKETLEICNEAVNNLRESRTLQARIETERFKGRLLYQMYRSTGDLVALNDAVETTYKSLHFFLLLGVTMGVINARRQYIHYLIEKSSLDAARAEIEVLARIVETSPDPLSKTKLVWLVSFYYYRAKKPIPFLKNLMPCIKESMKFGSGTSALSNILSAVKWYLSFLNGRGG